MTTEDQIVKILKREIKAEGFINNFKIKGKRKAAKKILGLFTQYVTHGIEEKN